MKAIRRFTVRTVLPEPLRQLEELVLNLRWSWHHETLDLFRAVDPALWKAVHHDPVRLLGEVAPERLARLAEDRRFLRRLQDTAEDLHEYLTAPRWYQKRSTSENAPACIAYFSPEYGITAALPQYSGGLGILAGDHLKTASDLGVPILGVGLLYRHGYFSQSLSPDGWQLERYPPIDPNGLPLTLLRERDGSPVRVAIGLPKGERAARAGVDRARRARPAVAARLRRRGQRPVRAGRHRPAVRRRRRPPAAPGDAARHRRRPGDPRVLPHHRAPRAGGLPHQRGPRRFLGLERIRELVSEAA